MALGASGGPLDSQGALADASQAVHSLDHDLPGCRESGTQALQFPSSPDERAGTHRQVVQSWRSLHPGYGQERLGWQHHDFGIVASHGSPVVVARDRYGSLPAGHGPRRRLAGRRRLRSAGFLLRGTAHDGAPPCWSPVDNAPLLPPPMAIERSPDAVTVPAAGAAGNRRSCGLTPAT